MTVHLPEIYVAEATKRAALSLLTGNPFHPRREPDAYRRWMAADAVESGVVSTLYLSTLGLSTARRNHAAAEGLYR